MFRQFFAVREGASPVAKSAGPVTRRSRRSEPGLENLEGRQLMSVSPQLLVDSPNLHVATIDSVPKPGSGPTSVGALYIRYKFGTVF
jgi:hypothetical protein